MYTICPLPLSLCLLKTTTQVCTLKMAEDELNPYSASSYIMSGSCVINLFMFSLGLFICQV
jgi:hypothetical protein